MTMLHIPRVLSADQVRHCNAVLSGAEYRAGVRVSMVELSMSSETAPYGKSSIGCRVIRLPPRHVAPACRNQL